MADASLNRREMLRRSGAAAAGCLLGGVPASTRAEDGAAGRVAGQPLGAAAGEAMLRSGGNAADAIVTAALVSAVVAPQHCGPGGYGGHAVVGLPGGQVRAVDFNTLSPAAMRPDVFPLDEKGGVPDRINEFGWLAAGVPGTLTGLEKVLRRFGTRSLAEAAAPAIRYAREGFPLAAGQVAGIRAGRARFMKDPGSARLYLGAGGEPPKEGELHRNPDLAAMLETLVRRGSVESFYRGDIGRQIAGAFQKNGGLLTEADMAAYQAQELPPLRVEWRGYTVCTAPLTAGGATIIQILQTLKALEWEQSPAEAPETLHALVEAMRLAWQDRLALLGDPQTEKIPLDRLLSDRYAQECAGRVREAVRQKRPVPGSTNPYPDHGTVHLSAVDRRGMMAALTLTHGNAYGARVTVDGLGLTLGQGMSRFDPWPGVPNSPGPRKHPLTNMCPTLVLHRGKPVLALGGAGARRIVNSVAEVLARFIGQGRPLDAALAAPRLQAEGDLNINLDPKTPEAHAAYLKEVGYTLRRGPAAALVSAVQPLK